MALLTMLASVAFAEDREPRDQTEANAIAACLATWTDSPFQGADRTHFKVLASSVKVMGIGSDVVDEHATAEPQLVLIKPAVNVMSKERFRLMNPNGWYCFQSTVTVLAKSEITAQCQAHLASSVDGVAVAGGNRGTDGVTVLGKAEVVRVGCPPRADAGPNAE